MMCDEEPSGGSMLGQRLGSYRIESRLGAGSMGIVYRGVSEETGETVAIKMARDVRESSPHRLLRSSRIMQPA